MIAPVGNGVKNSERFSTAFLEIQERGNESKVCRTSARKKAQIVFAREFRSDLSLYVSGCQKINAVFSVRAEQQKTTI